MDVSAFIVNQVVDPKTKQVVAEEYLPNPMCEYIKPYVLVPRNADLIPTAPEAILVPANGQSADVTLALVDEGMFEGAYFTARFEDSEGASVADPDLLFELIDNQRKVSLTGRPCHVQTVIGNGQRPWVLPESLPVDKNQPLIVRFWNLSQSDVYVKFQIHGKRMYTEQIRDDRLDRYVARRRNRNKHMSLYMCPLDTDPSITGGATNADYYLTNDANIYFEVRKITYRSTGVFKFQVIDEKSNGMQSGWVHIVGAAGIAQYPFIYYTPWVIQPGGKVTFRINELTGQTNKLYLTLSGRQHFVYPGP